MVGIPLVVSSADSVGDSLIEPVEQYGLPPIVPVRSSVGHHSCCLPQIYPYIVPVEQYRLPEIVPVGRVVQPVVTVVPVVSAGTYRHYKGTNQSALL